MSMPTGRRRSERNGLDPSGLAPRLARSGRRCGPGTGMGNDRHRYRQSDAVEAEAALPRMRQAFGARALSVLLEALQGRRPEPLAIGTLRDSRAGRGRRSRRRPAGIEAHPPGSGRIRDETAWNLRGGAVLSVNYSPGDPFSIRLSDHHPVITRGRPAFYAQACTRPLDRPDSRAITHALPGSFGFPDPSGRAPRRIGCPGSSVGRAAD